MIKVCIAGGTGWAGSALSKGVFNHPNMELVAVISRKSQGGNLAEILKLGKDDIPIFGNVLDSLEVNYDVLVEYTKPNVARDNILLALNHKIDVIVGTSGLHEEDYLEIEKAAIANNASVLAVGNFSLTAVLMKKFSEIATKFIPNYEIVDYASDSKVDAPSGTALELAHKLSKIQDTNRTVSDDEFVGLKESRGASVDHVQIHSVRLPGYVISIESLFGLEDERLSIRHDAGSSAEPYVKGALLAIEKVGGFKGLRRGLDSVMEI